MTELIETTLEMLQNRSAKIMIRQIAAELNQGVKDKKDQISVDWLYKFNQGKIEEPKHPKVEAKIKKLHQYLVSKKTAS